jgi:hypothetical protein
MQGLGQPRTTLAEGCAKSAVRAPGSEEPFSLPIAPVRLVNLLNIPENLNAERPERFLRDNGPLGIEALRQR